MSLLNRDIAFKFYCDNQSAALLQRTRRFLSSTYRPGYASLKNFCARFTSLHLACLATNLNAISRLKYLGLIYLLGFCYESFSQDKYNVCTITINSKEEREAFKARLNPKEFNFIELTELGSTKDIKRNDWFGHACKSGVQCDVLIISGHFGGAFVGSTPFKLTLDELEYHSCIEDCNGILKNPQEVFLFGCNTLATKEKDGRSPEEYLNTLLQHGISRGDAEVILESRYGVFGQSFKDRMQQVFFKIPRLYGFESRAPTGKQVQASLKKYLQKKQNYAAHLEKQALEYLSTALVQANFDLNRSIHFNSFTQCSGLSHQDPNNEIKKNICEIHSEKTSIKDKLLKIRILLNGKNLLTYLPSVKTFFEKNSPQKFKSDEKNIFDQIASNPKIKDEVLGALEKIKAPSLKINLAKFAMSMGFMESSNFKTIVSSVLKNILKSPVSIEAKDTACSISGDLEEYYEMSPQDYDQAILNEHNGLIALSCLKPTNQSVKNNMEEAALKLLKPKMKKKDMEIICHYLNIRNPSSIDLKKIDPALLKNEYSYQALACMFPGKFKLKIFLKK